MADILPGSDNTAMTKMTHSTEITYTLAAVSLRPLRFEPMPSTLIDLE